jgi:hypothetical protein
MDKKITTTTLANACYGHTNKSTPVGLNLPEIKQYLTQQGVSFSPCDTRSRLQEHLCSHLKLKGDEQVPQDSSWWAKAKEPESEEERDVKIVGYTGMNNLDKILSILTHRVRDTDFNKAIEKRYEALSVLRKQYDFDQRMKTEPVYKSTVDGLQRHIDLLERLWMVFGNDKSSYSV